MSKQTPSGEASPAVVPASESPELLAADALAAAVAEAQDSDTSRERAQEERRNRRRSAGPFSMRASVQSSAEGEILSLHNMFIAFHHPESGGQYSSSINLAGPGLLPTLLFAGLTGYGIWWLAPLLGLGSLTARIPTTVIACLLAMILERFFAHRRLDLQIAGGNYALYRNGRKRPFALGPISELELWVHGNQDYRRVRLIFPMKSLLSGLCEHDIFLQPVPSDTADVIEAFAKKTGVYK